jgi:hypothetical protein
MMKVRLSILAFISVAAVFIGLMLWLGYKRPVMAPPTVQSVTNSSPPAIPIPRVSVQSNAPEVQTANSTSNSIPLPRTKEGMEVGVLSSYNDVPIDFYGRLEDQFSGAIPYAAINFNVRVYNGYESTVKRGQVTSDGNGFFSITGYKGQDLGLAPQKNGYTLATTGTLYKYSRMENHPYVSYQNTPAVIKMWKLLGAEPLVSIDQHYQIHYTDAPVNFDLLTGKIVPNGGDIKITVTRPAGIISGGNPQDWSIEVAAVEGGLIETSVGVARITYAAPDSGYEPSKTFTMSKSTHSWYDAVHQMFFLQSRNGQAYSKVNLSFHINRNPDDLIDVTFNGVANTNGSRNWESSADTTASDGQ